MSPPDGTVVIREAQSADAAAMQRCVEAAYRHYTARIGKPPGPMLDDYARVIRTHVAFVAEDQTTIVGVLVLIVTPARMLLDNVAVHPAQQGKGIGRRLLALAESEARRRGFDSLQLYTHERMTENIDMYKRLGYVETERRTEQGYRRVYMQKTVADTAAEH